MKTIYIFFGMILVFEFLLTRFSYPQEYLVNAPEMKKAQLQFNKNQEKIKTLTLVRKNLPVKKGVNSKGKIKFFVDIIGKFFSKKGKLTVNAKYVLPQEKNIISIRNEDYVKVEGAKTDFFRVRVDKNGNFRFSVPVNGKRTDLSFIVVYPEGFIEQQKVRIYIPTWDGEKNDSRIDYRLGAGVSQILYKEKLPQISLRQISITVKGTLVYRLMPNSLDVSGNVYGNIMSLDQTPTTVTPARFYGINSRVGYHLPLKISRVKIILSSGWYWWGMLVPGNTYGIKALFGPQIFVVFSYKLTQKRGLYSYLKYAPIGESFGDFSSTNREYAAGIGYPIFWSADLPWEVTFDFASLQAMSSKEHNSSKVSSLSLGIQTRF